MNEINHFNFLYCIVIFHLITYKTMVKIEFKIDIICVRLIILNFLYYIV
jgi:hypothetical protein